MAKIILLVLLLVAIVSSTETSAFASETKWGLARLSDDSVEATLSKCDGAVGGCIGDDEEMEMESEISRRILWGGGRVHFISYGALAKDRVPCNRRGHSYYNCRMQGRANPYRRGCSVITRCARFLH